MNKTLTINKISTDQVMMCDLLEELFPICRSITGNGVRQTLEIISKHIPIKEEEVLSGTKVFDWTVPNEWNITDAHVMNEAGEKVIDFKKNNLHVVSYSIPVDKEMSLEELDAHLYSLEDRPDAIPYVTSYYQERWGFCLTHNERKKLKKGKYQVVIDSELKPGSLTYGELIIPGQKKEEIFLSTYICHPSMANNELSGPVVTTYLAKWLLEQKRKYTYRIVFVPETIGSITYLSKHIVNMKKNVIAGFNISCVGDDRAYSYLPSREGDTLADRVALHVLKHTYPEFIKYTYLDRGSDERQYCAPGIDLPVCSVMRTKYGAYPEYHTSLDNMDLVTEEGLAGGFSVLQKCLNILETNDVVKNTVLGEPQLSKRGLRSTLWKTKLEDQERHISNILAYSDGKIDLIEMAEIINVPVWELKPLIEILKDNDLLISALE